MENPNPVIVILFLFFLFFLILPGLFILVTFVCSMIVGAVFYAPIAFIEGLVSVFVPDNGRKMRRTKESFITWANKRRLIKECKLWKVSENGKEELMGPNDFFQCGTTYSYNYEWTIVVPRCPPPSISLPVAGILERVRRRDIGKNIKDVFPFASKQVLIHASNNYKPIAVKLSNLSYAWLRTKLIFTIKTEPFILADYRGVEGKNNKLVLYIPRYYRIRGLEVSIG